ncbi:IS200/IS605 family transposase [Arcticibacterium luteifluviistationis]|uniref:IS200/IS605 family transposase n=1 Tax=Arcticibacterium luteifluviistationis TaxID=1784714 RepID=A0A2Z4G738_9BACT|nr:IS200/IS605 family transposase [Arcticibacterium luteifluviistationis]AWV96997.1 IS200/IS605 family transposase [Arcticibacterium luteifluviistationis]
MSTYTQILYHLVFSTRNRERSLKAEGRPVLFKYIWGILKEKKCHLYRINGVEDHIHIVFSLHLTISLAALVKDIKLASSLMIKEKNLFLFTAWQEGYSAFTYSLDAKDNLIEYVKNQEERHEKVSFKDELISLLDEFQIEYKEEYLF